MVTLDLCTCHASTYPSDHSEDKRVWTQLIQETKAGKSNLSVKLTHNQCKVVAYSHGRMPRKRNFSTVNQLKG